MKAESQSPYMPIPAMDRHRSQGEGPFSGENPMIRWAIVLSGVFAAIAVVAGAFGEHMLKERLAEAKLSMWKTAVEYQIYHSLALLLVGVRLRSSTCRTWQTAGWSFVAGIVLFSGGLFLCASGGPMFFMGVVPIGGTAFIIGWIAVIVAGWREK